MCELIPREDRPASTGSGPKRQMVFQSDSWKKRHQRGQDDYFSEESKSAGATEDA